MNRLLRISVVSALALSACSPNVVGNGVLGQETRTVAPFDAVEMSLAAEANLTANAAEQRLTVSVDENLLQYILTPVEGGVLKLRLSGIDGIESVHPLRVVAQVRSLHAVRAGEASNVEVKQAGDPTPGFTFEVVAAGASSVKLQGAGGDRLRVDLSGASQLDASAYPVAGANVVLTGASVLRINSTGDVIGSAADLSQVEISGGGGCGALVLSGKSTCTTP